MQTTSTPFTTATTAARRKLHKRAMMSFPKTYAATTRFFTVGVSSIGGPDPIFGTGAVLQEWDKYDYSDYSDRLISMETTREMDILGSTIKAMADFTLNNSDDKFTPNVDPIIGAHILPGRPTKLFWGFDGESVPMFTGITEKIPSTGGKDLAAKFHAVDFLGSIFNIELDQAIMYVDQRTDQIISALLIAHAGLASNQFVLDVGMNRIPFAYFKKGDKLGKIIQLLVQAEMGQFFQDELGIFRFWNRQHNVTASPVWSFDHTSNVYSADPPSIENVINVVEITSRVRAVQAKQKLWESTNAVEILPGQSITIFADFRDDYGDLPVTSVDTPLEITAATTSSFEVNTARDSTGTSLAGILTMTASQRFATSYMMTFTNSGGAPGYVTKIMLYATPAKVISEIYHRQADAVSIGKYDEQVQPINNDFIQSETAAKSIATMLVEDRKVPANVRNINVKGVPQLQLGDIVNYNADDGQGILTYKVVRMVGKFGRPGLVQQLKLVRYTIQTYFQVGISSIGGPDKIAP